MRVARSGSRPETAAASGERAGRIINRYKMANLLTSTIRDGHLGWALKAGAIKKAESSWMGPWDPDQRAGRAADGRRRGAIVPAAGLDRAAK